MIEENEIEKHVQSTKESYRETIELLKSSNCTSQAKDDTATTTYIVNEESSRANSIKTTSILFTTLSLVLAYLLLLI